MDALATAGPFFRNSLRSTESQNHREEILAETDNMAQREAHHLYEWHDVT
jgi:hypothetical protein